MASSLVSHPRAPSDGAAGVATSLQAILALAPPQLPLDSESEGAMDLFTAASLGLDVTKVN
jgi:hypothetical protein